MVLAANDSVEPAAEVGQSSPLSANGGTAGLPRSPELTLPASSSVSSAVSDIPLKEKAHQKAEFAGPGLESGHYSSSIRCHPPPLAVRLTSNAEDHHVHAGWRPTRLFRSWLAAETQVSEGTHQSQYQVPELIKSVDQYPPGYGKVAASLDTDPGFLVFRKFGWLHNYVLLELQDELQQLEEKLEIHDKNEHIKGNRKRLKARRIDTKQKASRHDLIVAIHQKLGEYDEMLFRIERIQAMQRPLPRYQKSVCSTVHKESRMLGVEADWITRSDDLLTISRDAEHGWLNGFIEDILSSISKKMLMWAFSNDEQRMRSKGSKNLILLSPKRLDAFVRICLTLGLSLELFVPLLLLNKMQTNNPAETQRMGYIQILIIFIATLFFSASCSFFTRAKRHEVFGATAAYCAVFVVYLGNSSNVIVVTNT